MRRGSAEHREGRTRTVCRNAPPHMNDRLDERLRIAKPTEGHQDYTPRQTDNRRKAARRWWTKHAAETIHPKHTQQGRSSKTEGLFTTNRPDKPWLRWMDTDGRLHLEEELSAEELIRRWEETQ
jgi:hypothetical protein